MRNKSVLVPGEGLVRKPVGAPRVFKVQLDPTQARQLRQHAARRSIDPDAMFSLLITTILNDKLIDAVIDDDGSSNNSNTAA